MRKATLTDIALKLGISPSSVSKALSGGTGKGNTRISPGTLKRIQDAAREMNYRGNPGARALRTRRFHNIGFFEFRKRPGDYAFSEPTLNGLSEAAARAGQNIVFVRVPQEAGELADIPRALREEGLDALIIANLTALGEIFQNAVEAAGVPVIYLNEKRTTNAVYVNDVVSGRLMTAHLVGRGFRRIAMLAPGTSGNHYSTADRISGYLGIMREAGLEPVLKTYARDTWRYETSDWLAAANPAQRPEAIFCVDDHVALMLQRILYDLRLHIPGDIAIAGCNGEQLALHSPVPLTTLEIPFHEMGVRALEMAVRCADRKTRRSIPSLVLEPRLVIRESSINRATTKTLPRLCLHENDTPDVSTARRLSATES
ncbi:MAG: LacI family transcriptional regulator [Opitutaceae bacterium]|jgi:LacI family transcriptional regulator|nr:LacI family transcriptional regulator [Opitutaceae bacterium]